MYSSDHKIGGNPLSLKDISPLKQALIDSSLSHIPFIGAEYTWNNKSKNGPRTFCKLDHAFHNIHSINLWPNLLCKFLNPSISDHSPIILSWGENAIRRNPSWNNYKHFLSIVMQVWQELIFENPLYILKTKLQK